MQFPDLQILFGGSLVSELLCQLQRNLTLVQVLLRLQRLIYKLLQLNTEGG